MAIYQPMYQPYNPYSFYQPPMQPQIQPQTQATGQPQSQMGQQQNQNLTSSDVWVSSRQEAESYLVGINNAVNLWSNDGTHVYVKKTDASGRPEFRSYRLVDDTNDDIPDNEKTAYATKDDLLSINSKIKILEEKVGGLENGSTRIASDGYADTEQSGTVSRTKRSQSSSKLQ